MARTHGYSDPHDISDLLDAPLVEDEVFIPRPAVVQPTSPLDLPADAMYGWLGEQARKLDGPLGWCYISCLCLYSAHGIAMDQPEPEIRPTLYAVLIGPPEDGKSRTFRRARQTISLREGAIKSTVPGSDRGMEKLFAPPKPIKGVSAPDPQLQAYCILNDEFKQTLSKITIQGSSLAPMLCSMWSDDEVSGADKSGVHEVWARVSLLGNLPIKDRDEFRAKFSSEVLDGLYSRMLIVPGPTGWDWDDLWRAKPEYRPPSKVRLTRLPFDMRREWSQEPAPSGTKRGRIGEIALRVALISAAANGDTEITRECMEAALRLAEWQERVRAYYTPSEATSPDAVITTAILDALAEEINPITGKPRRVRFWDIARKRNWARKYGSAAITRAKQGLIESGFIEADFVLDANGNETRKPTGFVKLVVA